VKEQEDRLHALQASLEGYQIAKQHLEQLNQSLAFEKDAKEARIKGLMAELANRSSGNRSELRQVIPYAIVTFQGSHGSPLGVTMYRGFPP